MQNLVTLASLNPGASVQPPPSLHVTQNATSQPTTQYGVPTSQALTFNAAQVHHHHHATHQHHQQQQQQHHQAHQAHQAHMAQLTAAHQMSMAAATPPSLAAHFAGPAAAGHPHALCKYYQYLLLYFFFLIYLESFFTIFTIT